MSNPPISGKLYRIRRATTNHLNALNILWYKKLYNEKLEAIGYGSVGSVSPIIQEPPIVMLIENLKWNVSSVLYKDKIYYLFHDSTIFEKINYEKKFSF